MDEKMIQKNEEVEVDLGRLLQAVWRRIWLVALVAVLTTAIALVGLVLFVASASFGLAPAIVGISFEFNRYVGGHDNPVTNFLAKPGLWMQNFTTFEPDDGMIEVAIEAMKRVIPEEKGKDQW